MFYRKSGLLKFGTQGPFPRPLSPLIQTNCMSAKKVSINKPVPVLVQTSITESAGLSGK